MQTASRTSFRVHFINRRLCTGFLLMLGALLLPATAGAVTATLSAPAGDYNGTFTVSWYVDPGPNVGGHTELHQRVNGGAWSIVAGGDLTTNESYTVTPSASGSYEYIVVYYYMSPPYCPNMQPGAPCMPIQHSGSTALHTTLVQLQPPAAPSVTLSAVSACSSSVTVNWSPGSGYPSGVTRKYDVQESTNGGTSWTTILSGTTATGTSRSLPSDSLTRQYKVWAYFTGSGDTSQKSQATKTVSKSWCAPGPTGTPTLSQPTPTSSTNVSVSWAAPTSGGTVQGYRLQRRDVTSGSGWTTVYTGSSRSTTDAGAKTRGHSYAYEAQAYNGANGPWSTAASVYVPYAPPPAPNLDDNVGGAAGYNGVYDITFSSAGGTVTGFKFQEIESANDTPLASDWPASVEEIAGNGPQTRSYDQPANFSGDTRYYHYRVKATNANAESDWVTVSVAQNYYPEPGAVDVFEQVGLATPTGAYTLRWEPPSGDEDVTHYKLDRLETAGVEYPTIPDVDGQPEYTQTLTGGVSGQTYHHSIEACFQPNEPGAEEACSGYTNTLAVYIPYPVPNTPANLTGPDGSVDGSFEVTWSPSTSGTLDHYELEETVNGSSTILNRGTATSLSRSGANGQYSYRIRACSPDADGPLTPAQACSAWSASISFNAFTTPAEFQYNLNDTTFLPTLGEGEFVAITQGKLGVDDGAASYSVPIELPPAVNNLKPNLALTYNSRGGNGLMGVGWSLSGLSTIRRCSPTVATEGATAQDSNPRYTTADRLCLDGKKLVIASNPLPASDSAYWASGAEYRTEIDSFSQIKAIGTQQSFEVKTRDGLILTYGDGSASQNSRIYAPGQTSGPVSVWALDKVKDRYNNEYTIHYQYNTADGDYYPTHIDFAPGASVVFSYIDRDADSAGSRSDMPWGYDNGQVYKHPKLLNKITTTIDGGGTTVREVDINYKRSDTTDRYLVSDITECGFEDGVPVCAAPLTFDWQAGELGFEATATPLQSCAGQAITVSDLQIGDIDNDGYDDLFGKTALYWGGPTCFSQAGAWATAGSADWKGAQLIGTPNGKALLVTEEDPNSTASPKAQFINVIELDRAAGTATVHALSTSAVNPTSIVVMDMNNDGREDFLFGSNVWLQQATPPVDFVPGASVAMLTSQATAQPVEYTGDGLADLFVSYLAGGPVDSNYTDISAYTQSGAGTFSYTAQLPVSDTVPFTTTTNDPFHQRFVVGGSQTYNVLDVNGDGKRDYVYHQKPGEQADGLWYVKLNTGNGFGPPQAIGVSSGTPKNQYSFPYDWDKDGRQDLIVRDANLTDYCQDGQDCWNVVLSTYNGGGYGIQVLGVDPFNGHLLGGLANTPVAMPPYQVLRGDFNHDGLIDVSYGSDVWYAKQQQPDLLKTVTGGFGKQIALEYSPLVNDDNHGQPLYTPSTEKPVFPQRHAPRDMQVVKKLIVSDGQGGMRDRYFNYTGAKQDAQGRGFLGFETITVTDAAKGIVATTTYKQEFPYIGRIANSEVKDTAGNLISLIDNVYDVQEDNSRFPYLQSSIQRQYGLMTSSAGSPVSVTKTTNTFDAYGNLTDRITETGTGLAADGTVTGLKRKVTESNTIPVDDTVNWLLGFVTQHEETAVDGAGANARTVTTTFEAWPNTLDVKVRTDFVNTAVWKKTTTNRNANGVVTDVTVEAGDLDNTSAAPRTTTWGGFTDTMYPATETNAKGHITSRTYNKRFGVIASETDPNLRATTRAYDAFGRLEKETAPNGTVTAIKYFYCSTAPVTCPSDAMYLSATEITNPAATGKLGAPLSIVYYDQFQRQVRQETYSLNGAVVKVDTEYDANGRLSRVSEPYTGMLPTDWTVYSNYDALDRPHNISGADGGSVNYVYSKEGEYRKTVETVTAILPDNSTRTQITARYTNALDQVEQVLDAALTSIDYTYDTQGNLKTTEVNGDPLTTVTVTHDKAGNKTYIKDPDSGEIYFDYNGFGELRRQTWQKNTTNAKSIVYEYDKLGRKVKRTDMPVGGTSVIYTWTWDTLKKGLLTQREGNGFTETYGYNGQALLISQTADITGLGTRTFGYSYDEFSRPKTVTYPDGLTVEHEYHAMGLPVQTRDLTDNSVLWTLGEDSDTRGNLFEQRFGNGVITLTDSNPKTGRVSRIQTGWPTSGGLAGLTGNIQDLEYEFDTLGNLYSRTTGRTDINGTPEEYTAESFSYDNLNRLKTTDTTWVDMGMSTRPRSYEYDALGNLTYRSDIGTLTYDRTTGGGVHAVTAANGKSYHYDAYGNMTNRDGVAVEYDVFNKPTQIGNTHFSYGPDHARFKQENGDRTTYYINGGLYEEIVGGAVTTTKSYVGGYLVRAKTAGQTSFTYLHKDHLGSVEAMTDQWGNLIDRMSFDPWGQRQYADWADGDPTGGDPDYYPTTKGYTGHEMLDQEQLIHMGGRVYDPLIGRFLSPDLLISAPYNSQSFNRYSYVLNNPLSLIDPSGYMEEVVSHGNSGMDCRGGCPEIEKRMFRTQATFFGENYLRQQNSFFQDSTAQYFAQQGDPFQNVDFNVDLTQGNGEKNSSQELTQARKTAAGLLPGRADARDEYGRALYLKDDGSIAISDEIPGGRSGLDEDVLRASLGMRDGKVFIRSGALGANGDYRLLEIVHNHSRGHSLRLSGADVITAETWNINITVIKGRAMSTYHPKGIDVSGIDPITDSFSGDDVCRSNCY